MGQILIKLQLRQFAALVDILQTHLHYRRRRRPSHRSGSEIACTLHPLFQNLHTIGKNTKKILTDQSFAYY